MSARAPTLTRQREVTFGISGMTCASCVRRIEKALGKVEGVEQASVNLATEKARVVYDPSLTTPEQLQAAIEQAGYGVRDLLTGAGTPATDAGAGGQAPPRSRAPRKSRFPWKG
jgi:P-type Cu+ transporter